MKKILNVMYQSDDFYILASAASITSLLINNRHFDEINIYYLGYELSSDSIKKLKELTDAFSNANLLYIDSKTEGFNEVFETLPGARAWNDRYITWFKLVAFGKYTFNTDTILYLNPHSIINGPLDELMETNMGENVFGLSYDCLIESHKKQIGLDYKYGYYNCGIMLVNAKKWKEDKLTDYCLKLLEKDNNYVIVDQDFCNLEFKDNILKLGPEYNFSSAYYAYPLDLLLSGNNLTADNYYSLDELMAEYYSPKIIHSSFGLTGKPWEAGAKHPNHQLWNKYIQLSPWRDAPRPVAKKTFYWFLYDHLPKRLFMFMYHVAVKRSYGGK